MSMYSVLSKDQRPSHVVLCSHVNACIISNE